MSETHRARHIRLHDAVDELVADYLKHHANADLRHVTVQALLDWSGAQARTPEEPRQPDTNGHHNGVTFAPGTSRDDDPPEGGSDKSGPST